MTVDIIIVPTANRTGLTGFFLLNNNYKILLILEILLILYH